MLNRLCRNAGVSTALIIGAALSGCGGVSEQQTSSSAAEQQASNGAAEQKAATNGAPQYADMLFFGGVIYTGTDKAEAVAVTNGAISAVGSLAGLEEAAGPDTQRINLNGAFMYPGFVDSHGHLFGIGQRELTLNLEGVGSVAEMVEKVAAAVSETDSGATVYGRGWIETGWPEGRFPSRDDLDPISADNPVVLYRADGHAAVVNSAAFAAVGVAAETADPAGGRIEKDAAGRPTGMLIDAAMSLVRSLVAKPSLEQKRTAYAIASDVYSSLGWTGIHNMSANPDDLSLIEELVDQGGEDGVNIRVYNAIDEDGLDALVESGHRRSQNGRAVTRALKLYVDGALGSRGAALTRPYADKPGTNGLLLMEKEKAIATMAKANSGNIQVNTHAIGDRGNRLVLNWYEETFGGVDTQDRRWRVEHAQILHADDVPRFQSLGVIPSMKPSHAIGDLFFAPARLGPDRLSGAYAWRSLIESGSIIAGGTDAPVERGDPRIEFYAAVSRTSIDGFQGADWVPEQAVSREEALQMFTKWPAYAAFQEDMLGSIEPGKRADFTVYNADIMTIEAAEVLTVETVMTVVDGEIVYRAE